MSERFKIFSSAEAAENALPDNTPKKLVLNKKSYCILRKNGEYFAMDDACPHNKASLSTGRTNAFGEIICPLHEYRYDLRTGRESNLQCQDLQTYPVMVENEGVFLII